jgi:hypothetical protein
MTYPVVGHAGRSRRGEGGSPGGSHRPLAVASCRHRAVYEQKKLRSCGCFRTNRGEQLPGSGATLLYYPFFLAQGAFFISSRPFRACGGKTRAQPHELTPLPGFLSDLPAGFFALICHSLRSRNLSCRSSFWLICPMFASQRPSRSSHRPAVSCASRSFEATLRLRRRRRTPTRPRHPAHRADHHPDPPGETRPPAPARHPAS